MELNGTEIADLAANSAVDRKALDVVVLDLRGLLSFTDYFVICSGTSDTHIEGIAENIENELYDQGVRLWHREGGKKSSWILLDYIDVIVHIFTRDSREFYSLERLWGDAPKTAYQEDL